MWLLIPFGNHFEWLPHCRIPPAAPAPVHTQHHSLGRKANCNGDTVRCPADAAGGAGASSTCRADTPSSSNPLDASPKRAAADTPQAPAAGGGRGGSALLRGERAILPFPSKKSVSITFSNSGRDFSLAPTTRPHQMSARRPPLRRRTKRCPKLGRGHGSTGIPNPHPNAPAPQAGWGRAAGPLFSSGWNFGSTKYRRSPHRRRPGGN